MINMCPKPIKYRSGHTLPCTKKELSADRIHRVGFYRNFGFSIRLLHLHLKNRPVS